MENKFSLRLETNNLILRNIELNDAESLFEMDSDIAVCQYLCGERPLTEIAQCIDYINSIQLQYENNKTGRLSVVEKSTMKVIGWCGIKFVTELNDKLINYYDIGFRFNKAYWNKGYATESSKAILDYYFSNYDHIDVIYADVETQHIGSIRVLEKIGLKPFDTYILDNIHNAWYKITKEEWLLSQNK